MVRSRFTKLAWNHHHTSIVQRLPCVRKALRDRPQGFRPSAARHLNLFDQLLVPFRGSARELDTVDAHAVSGRLGILVRRCEAQTVAALAQLYGTEWDRHGGLQLIVVTVDS